MENNIININDHTEFLIYLKSGQKYKSLSDCKKIDNEWELTFTVYDTTLDNPKDSPVCQVKEIQISDQPDVASFHSTINNEVSRLLEETKTYEKSHLLNK